MQRNCQRSNILTQLVCVDTFPLMNAGRPNKEPDVKFSERVPFMALPQEYAGYVEAQGITGHKHLSEWIRATLNAEVEKLRKRQAKQDKN